MTGVWLQQDEPLHHGNAVPLVRRNVFVLVVLQMLTKFAGCVVFVLARHGCLQGTMTTKAVMVTRPVSLMLTGTEEGLLVLCLRDGWKMVQNRGSGPCAATLIGNGGAPLRLFVAATQTFLTAILRSRETTESEPHIPPFMASLSSSILGPRF